MYTIDEVKSAVWMEVDIEIALVTATFVEEVDWNIATITTQFADILEIGFNQTVHQCIVL